MMTSRYHNERGETNMFLITTIIFAVLTVGLGIGFGWAYMQMLSYKDDSDQKVAAAVEIAKNEQKQTDKEQFDEDYKKPNNVFTGPANYGSVSFEYPKTWSVYVENDGSNSNEYSVYFNPNSVPTVRNTTPYALRIVIVDQKIDQVLMQYDGKIKQGELKSSTIKLADAINDPNSSYGKGTRINGQFDQTINGSAVFFDIRGRTLKVFTDSDKFKKDFDETILKTLKYRD
ncbi:MAG: hypothetical protein LBQ11_00480 [Candidatus Nomurabacteria bacterium]|jgi:hypothetical protein|nr:hypothetical protein [Candidatus Nomurabacteria bacterium]